MQENKAEIADYPALRRPRLAAGVGAKTATMIWALTALVGVVIGMPWGLVAIPIAAVIHGGLTWFFRKDHQIVPNNLHAGTPSHGEVWMSRPRGFGNGVPLN